MTKMMHEDFEDHHEIGHLLAFFDDRYKLVH
jgi:hypothetical protein